MTSANLADLQKLEQINIKELLTFNSDQDLDLDSAAYMLGQQFFQSFLLAGERVLESGLERKNTDEGRFSAFYTSLPEDQQKILSGYFKQQAKLDSMQRAKLLGNFVDLSASEPLTMDKSIGALAADLTLQSSLTYLSSRLSVESTKLKAARKTVTTSPSSAKLSLILDSLTVNEAQDDYYVYVPRFGWPPYRRAVYNQVDEVSLLITTIDETGDVHTINHNLGSIKEGNRKVFDKTLTYFNIKEGGNNFPKTYIANVSAFERDNGSYNQFVSQAAKFIKNKVTAELIKDDVIESVPIISDLIPDFVSKYIAGILKGFLDKFISWATPLLQNSYDYLGNMTRKATLGGYTPRWNSSGTSESRPWTWVFSGAQGRWSTRMHWKLSIS